MQATLTRKTKAKAELIIVGREAEGDTINYYIQSGEEKVYVARIENGQACGCKRINGEACEAYLYSAHSHKGCKHTTLALQNEQERDNDLKQHLHDGLTLHSCISCGYQVKRENSLCHNCAW